MSTFTGPDGVTYELTMTAEAEVIPGPLSRIRALCEDAKWYGFAPADELAMQVLKILNEG